MSIAETVYEKLKAAPPEVAQQVLEFLEMLEAKGKSTQKPPASFDEFLGF